MNKYTVEIYNPKSKSWDPYRAVFPLKFANLLDERLDEAEVFIKRVPLQYFLPQTKVRITLKNTPPAKFTQEDFERIQARAETDGITYTYNPDKTITETLVINMLVASDSSNEVPSGSGYFDHQLYLIERTKFMERFIGDSITFTNALGNDYTNS